MLDAQGMTFTVHNGTAPVTIGQVKGFNFAPAERTEKDRTTLASTREETAPGLAKAATLTLEILFDPADAGQQELVTLEASGVTREFVITYSDGTTLTSDGWVKAFPNSGNTDEDVTSSVTVKFTGAHTWVFA